MDATLEKEVDRLGRSSRVAAGITILGVIGVGLAMVYATSQLRALQMQVATSEAKLKSLNEELETKERQVEELAKEIKKDETEKQKYEERISDLKQQLLNTTDLSRSEHPIDFEDLKGVAVGKPAEAKVLRRILELKQQKIGWQTGGRQRNEGFDSPSFAAFVLQSLGIIGQNKDQAQPSLLDKLPLVNVNDHQVGDLVWYPERYAMFFFVDHHQEPFVIGMTPLGIVALHPNFKRIEKVARPDYRRQTPP